MQLVAKNAERRRLKQPNSRECWKCVDNYAKRGNSETSTLESQHDNLEFERGDDASIVQYPKRSTRNSANTPRNSDNQAIIACQPQQYRHSYPRP
jgi:hypothetical protein